VAALIGARRVWLQGSRLSTHCPGLGCAALQREVGPETTGGEVWGAPRLEAGMGQGIMVSRGGQQEPACNWEGASWWGYCGTAQRFRRNGNGLALSMWASF